MDEPHFIQCANAMIKSHGFKLKSKIHHTALPCNAKLSQRGGNRSTSFGESQYSCHLLELSADIQLGIFFFLDLVSLRQAMKINRELRALMMSHHSHTLWLSHCQSLWPGDAGNLQRQLIDDLHLPTAAGMFSKYNVNLQLLLGMTPKFLLPFRIDVNRSTNRQIIFSKEEDETTTLQFTGEVGMNDKEVSSIRGAHPLPKPTLRFPKMSIKRLSLKDTKTAKWKPFVSPYMANDMVVVSPRLVTYFETTILIAPKQDDQLFRISFDALEPKIQDCIAIGLATETFDCQSGLPGWNRLSFGYHGDNGGFYHGSGRMQKRSFPFGPGDTVGCGIDYARRGIFFTRNNIFLGFVWKGLDIKFLSKTKLYPIVGIDSKHPVSVNLGSRPFEFDLSRYIQRYSSSLSSRYQF